MKIEYEKYKGALHLTLTVRISQNDALHTLSEIETLKSRVISLMPDVDSCLYPKDRLHFSLINFLTFKNIPKEKIENEVEKIKNSKWLASFNEIFDKEVLEPMMKLLPMQFNIKKFFLKNPDYPGVLSGSLSLNAFPEQTEWKKWQNEVETFLASLRKKTCKLVPDESKIVFEIKSTPEGAFAINLFRFLAQSGQEISTANDALFDFLTEENRRLKRSPIRLKLDKPELVVSDSYLWNADPFII